MRMAEAEATGKKVLHPLAEPWQFVLLVEEGERGAVLEVVKLGVHPPNGGCPGALPGEVQHRLGLHPDGVVLEPVHHLAWVEPAKVDRPAVGGCEELLRLAGTSVLPRPCHSTSRLPCPPTSALRFASRPFRKYPPENL